MLHQVIVVDGVDGKHQPTVQHTDKIRNMKNINKGLGYLVVILFWLVVITLLSSCTTSKKCCIKTAQEVYEYEGLIVE